MADFTKVSFPSIPAAHWWNLREKFKKTLLGNVTVGYLMAIGISKASAIKLISPLRNIGLIDADGKPTERALRWRNDSEYAAVCGEIIKQIYPQELIDAVPDPKENRNGLKSWFANKLGVGEDAASKMSSFYELLTEKDASKSKDGGIQSNSGSKSKNSFGTPKKATKVTLPKIDPIVNSERVDRVSEDSKLPNTPIFTPQINPSLHIDIQIHISSDASDTQIDNIFKSMATHLYKRSE